MGQILLSHEKSSTVDLQGKSVRLKRLPEFLSHVGPWGVDYRPSFMSLKVSFSAFAGPFISHYGYTAVPVP